MRSENFVTVNVCICSIFDDHLNVLLKRRELPPFINSWTIPESFFNNDDESLESVADRILLEESIKKVYIEQLRTYSDIKRRQVISVCYFAILSSHSIDTRIGNWFPLKNLPKDLVFNHEEILNDLLKRLEGKINYSPIAFNFLPKQFTWNDLQKVYEIILNKKFVAPNFRRNILLKYDLKELKEKKKTLYGRPSSFLSFKKEIL